MSKWSRELQELTKEEYFPGAIIKNENHDFEVLDCMNLKKIIINGINNDVRSAMPTPSDEVLATFQSIDEMVEVGWVLD